MLTIRSASRHCLGWRHVRRLLLFTLALAPLASGARGEALAQREAPLRCQEVLPLTTVEFSGHRYVVQADLGLTRRVPLMIHGNARMFLTLTHEVGEHLTGGPVAKVEEYGYSAKGKGLIRVPQLRLGKRRIADLHDVPVFDYIAEGGGPVQGMLGVPFLVAERAGVDFSKDALLLGVARTKSPGRSLLQQGYKQIALAIDANNRVTIPATFPGIDRALPITPSTVATALTLHRAPFAGKLPMTRDTTDTDHSPNRTNPEIYLSESVEFVIAGVRFNSPAALEDFAEYANVPEADVSSFGFLGYDWMKAHDAILDYANRRLYFKP